MLNSGLQRRRPLWFSSRRLLTIIYQGGAILAIPTALLRRFYVNNSLQNNDEGFSFRLTNRIAPTTLVSLGPVEIDDALYAPDQLTITSSHPHSATDIDERAPFFLPIGKKILLSLAPGKLKQGNHHVVLHAVTLEVGPVMIEFDDTIT